MEEFNKLIQSIGEELNIKVTLNIRVVEYKNNKIKAINKKEIFTLVRNNIESDKLNKGVNVIKCHGCGASIDVTKKQCDYCKTKINYLQEWYLKD